MNYPDHLLPKLNFKIISSESDLSNCFLIRNTPTKDICIPETKKIDENIVKIQSDHLGDFSTNILDVFTEEDIKYQIIGEKKDYFHSLWTVGDKVEMPIHQDDFEADENKGCFYLSIDEILEQTVNYPEDNPTIEAKCRVIHTPTNCNFWHFSIRWFTNKGFDIRELEISKNQRKKFLALTKALVIELALIEKPEFSSIKAEFYR